MRMADGEDFIIYSDVDRISALDRKYVTPQIERAFAKWPLFTPLVQVSFGIYRTIESEFHTYQVMAPGETIGSTTLKTGYGVSNYNHDREITPEGKCVMKLLFDSPLELWENMDKVEYRKEKEKITEDACKKLEKLYPDAKGHIEVADVATPMTDIKFTGVWKGAFEGFMPTSKNMIKSIKHTVKGLDNFYLTGQWLFPGGGRPLLHSRGNGFSSGSPKKTKRNSG